MRTNPIYITYYIFWSKFIFVEVIPYFTIMVLNSRIIGKIWKSSRFRRRFVENPEDPENPEMTSRQKREANLGVVLIAISVIFIVCQSFKIVPDVYEVAYCRIGSSRMIKDNSCETTDFVDNVIDLSHLLLAINSSANFIIYTWRGQKFREVLMNTFGLPRCLPGSVSSDSVNGAAGNNHTRNLEMTEVTHMVTTPMPRAPSGSTSMVIHQYLNGSTRRSKKPRKTLLASASATTSPMMSAAGSPMFSGTKPITRTKTTSAYDLRRTLGNAPTTLV